MRLGPAILVVLCAALARAADAQVPDSAARGVRGTVAPAAPMPGATISGVVRDSIARVPLVGAWVQLVTTEGVNHVARTVISDAAGRYTIDDVPDGHYLLGFQHPLLDSLGVDPTLRVLDVARHRPVRVDLASPSPERLRAAVCGPQSPMVTGAGAAVIGVVRDARDGVPVAGALVTGEWMELVIRPRHVAPERMRVAATTSTNGWFGLCNVPNGGEMFLSARRGADTTDLIEVQVPISGFLRRELYLGLGDGQLRGTVVTVDGNRPLVGAMVRVSDGPQARANDRGEWMLMDVPAGSRVLEVHAIGYYPVQRAVDVIPNAPPVQVTMATFKSVLDTVRIIVERASDRSQGGFEQRRRSGMGRYVTVADIQRYGAIQTSDILRTVAGVRVDDVSPFGMVQGAGGAGEGSDRVIRMRSAFFGGLCSPAIYLDGMHMFQMSAGELDVLTNPKDIKGIEVYSSGMVPPQFERGLSGCGSIVIWTKR